MRSISILVVVAALPLTQARAEIADTTGSLGAGSLSLAAEFQANMYRPNPMLVNFHEAVGLASGWDLYLRQGLGVSDYRGVYLGGGVKWTILHASSKASRPGIALWLGGHAWTNGGGGADATIAVDYPFTRVRPYLGLDANLDFGRGYPDPDFLLGLFGGVRIGIVKNVAWFVEGGLGILGSPRPHFISTGPKIYI